MEGGADLLILETFGNLDELREAVLAAREVAGDELPVIAQVTIDDFGHLPGGADTETFTRDDGLLAGGRHRAELLGGSEGHARDHRADDAVFLQAA